MRDSDTTYLIDSNVLIQPYRQYYKFSLAPSFWERLLERMKEGRIVLLDMVLDEATKGDEDELTLWLEKHKNDITIYNHKNEKVISNYAKVIRWIQECGFYNEEALRNWAQYIIADPWLIAVAMSEEKFVIVTFEQRAGELSKKQPRRNAKIPDVAEKMGIETIDLFQMMQDLDIKIG